MNRLHERIPLEKRNEIISMYLNGDNSIRELSAYYNVKADTINKWVYRYRKSGKIVSLQLQTKSVDDMARKKQEEKSPEVLELEARIRELELQNLALNTLIDNLGPSSRGTSRAARPDYRSCL